MGLPEGPLSLGCSKNSFGLATHPIRDQRPGVSVGDMSPITPGNRGKRLLSGLLRAVQNGGGGRSKMMALVGKELRRGRGGLANKVTTHNDQVFGRRRRLASWSR